VDGKVSIVRVGGWKVGWGEMGEFPASNSDYQMRLRMRIHLPWKPEAKNPSQAMRTGQKKGAQLAGFHYNNN